jgi:hypothetical protein
MVSDPARTLLDMLEKLLKKDAQSLEQLIDYADESNEPNLVWMSRNIRPLSCNYLTDNLKVTFTVEKTNKDKNR